MRFVFVSYNYSPDIHSPQEWLDRVKIYVGSLESLAKNIRLYVSSKLIIPEIFCTMAFNIIVWTLEKRKVISREN